MKRIYSRRLAASIIAPLSAIFVFACLFLGPLILVFLSLGLPPDAKGPSWGVWVLIPSGGIGAGGALLTHHFILEKLGGFNEREIKAKWHGR